MKYKKCCISAYNEDIEEQNFAPRRKEQDDDYIPLGAVNDYSIPLIDEAFFAGNEIHEISAPRLLYSCLLRPEIEGMAMKVTRQFIDRGKEELQRIERAKDAEMLIGIMKNNPDPINHTPLIDRLVKEKAQAAPLILQELKKPQNDSFVELAVKILLMSETDYSKEIIDIINSGNNRKAYDISILCVLLGFYDNDYSERLLWNYYHYMKFNYPHETYSDGPLLGLIRIQERNKERASLH